MLVLDGNQTAENAVTHLQKRVCRKNVCTHRAAQHGDFQLINEVWRPMGLPLIGAHHAGIEILGAEYSYGPRGCYNPGSVQLDEPPCNKETEYLSERIFNAIGPSPPGTQLRIYQ